MIMITIIREGRGDGGGEKEKDGGEGLTVAAADLVTERMIRQKVSCSPFLFMHLRTHTRTHTHTHTYTPLPPTHTHTHVHEQRSSHL